MSSQDNMQALVTLAKSFVGIHEQGGDNSGPVVEMFQSVIGRPEKEPWCVSFVQYCIRETDRTKGSSTLLIPTESSQILWMKSPEKCRIAHPEPGAIVIWTKFQNDLPLSIGHAGIVTKVGENGNYSYMRTVEGNTSPESNWDNVVRDSDGHVPDGVYEKLRPVRQTTGYMRITGFLLPWCD